MEYQKFAGLSTGSVGIRRAEVAIATGGSFGTEYPLVRGKTLGIATMHGWLFASSMTMLMQSGPAGGANSTAAASPSGGGGPSSSNGLAVEVGSFSSSARMRDVQILRTSPLASRIRIVAGQMTSMASPILPAMTSSPSAFIVTNGQVKIEICNLV